MDPNFIDSLAKGRSSPEPLEDKTIYKLTAQLKDPDILIKGFKEIDIEQFPVKTEVFIQEDINTYFGSQITEIAKTEAEILGVDDIHGFKRMYQLHQHKVKLKQKLLKNEDVVDKFNDISILLQPSKFSKYFHLQASRDFQFYGCEWGELYRALGMMTLPKQINVISRTDLTINKKAVSGELLYDSSKFHFDIENIFN